MSSLIVGASYGSALGLSLLALWYFGPKRWYWHVTSVLVAIWIGITPLFAPFNTPAGTLFVGWVFVFLFVWGTVAPAFALLHHELNPHPRHH